MTQSINLKTAPAPMRMLFRPILLAAVGLHALLLFTPLPAEQKPKEPDDKKNPIKVTQLPTATPPTAKSKAVTKTAKAPAKPTVALAATRTLPTPSAPSSAPAINPFASSDAAISAATTSAAPSASTEPFPPSPGSSATPTVAVTSAKPFTGDPKKALNDLLAELFQTSLSASTGNATIGSGKSANPAPLEEISQPDLLYQPKPQGQSPETLPGLEKPPLFVSFPVEENLNLTAYYQKALEPKLKGIFESVTEVGDYGDGPLFKLTRGSYTAYLSLMPPKTSVGAIISVWSKDPR